MEDKEKIQNRASTWCVVIEGNDVMVEHDGDIHFILPREHIAAIANEMADAIRCIIIKMPKNGMKKFQLSLL